MEKKKVLFVATVVKTHIMQFHIPYLRMLQELGWETAVAAKNDYEDPAQCRIPYCDHFYDLPFARLPWKKDNIASYRMLKKIIDEGSYDLIHCHTPVGAMIARLAAAGARKKGTKVIYTAHGFHFFKGAPLLNWLLYYPAEWLLAPLTDLLITINREDHALAQKRMRAKRIEYVPGVGIDLNKVCCTGEEAAEKRRELGFAGEDFLILTVAEMTPNKNHTTILKALSLLKDQPEFGRMHYLICGRGQERENLERQARELGIQDHVHFLGYRTDANKLYSCCDLFALMSFREGLSVALMEAMASGIPVMCSRIRGNTDLMDHEISGLFPENTPEGVSREILRLYRDPNLRRRLGENSREKIRFFGEESVHRQMKDLYLNI